MQAGFDEQIKRGIEQASAKPTDEIRDDLRDRVAGISLAIEFFYVRRKGAAGKFTRRFRGCEPPVDTPLPGLRFKSDMRYLVIRNVSEVGGVIRSLIFTICRSLPCFHAIWATPLSWPDTASVCTITGNPESAAISALKVSSALNASE